MRCVEYDAYSFDATEVSNFGEIQDVTFIKPVDSIKGDQGPIKSDQGSIKVLASDSWVFHFKDYFTISCLLLLQYSLYFVES